MGLQSGVLAAVSIVLWPIGDDKQLVGEGLGSLYRGGVMEGQQEGREGWKLGT